MGWAPCSLCACRQRRCAPAQPPGQRNPKPGQAESFFLPGRNEDEKCFTCSSCSHCSKKKREKGKFKGNWTRSFKHGCSCSKLFHEYPVGSVHMDSRRLPAVLLLIKTGVITFPVLLEQALGGAAVWRAQNASSSPQAAPRPATKWGRGCHTHWE